MDLVVAVAAAVGGACVTVAVTHQHMAPQPPLSVEAPSSAPAGVRAARATTGARRPAPAPRPTGSTRIGPVLAASLPTDLAIPAIGVQSRLLRLGLAADGTMAVPPPGPTYDRAGWYGYSPAPGSLGPAVLAGHVDSAANGPSVFFRLGDLRPGDTVLVTRADGSVAVFTVDEVRRYSKTGFPTDLVYDNTDHAALRLITCGGRFDDASGHYTDNIVVLASLVRSSPAPTGQ